jgi:hypothetical protein
MVRGKRGRPVRAMDIYRPELWHEFFVTVGGAAAALTGLVFVAISLHLDVIAHDATHRARAEGTLAGFSAVFMICALALMGSQDNRAVGVEWAIVASVPAIVYVKGYVQGTRKSGSAVGLSPLRSVLLTTFYVVEIAGAILLALGYGVGSYIAATAMLAVLAFGIAGAWLLLVGVQQGKA